MKAISVNRASHDLAALSLLIIGLFSNAAIVKATEHETACKEYVQGKIAWDPASNYTSASKWDEKNLAYLCQGTTTPKAPGDCFHKVMTGHVSYGNSDKWEWKNALELCTGSSDAEKTVNCFKGKITDKVDWQTAISQCHAEKTVKNVAE